jgi:hypothetical protein
VSTTVHVSMNGSADARLASIVEAPSRTIIVNPTV